MNYIRDASDARDWNSKIVDTEDGQRLAITLAGRDGRALALHLTPQQGIDLARYLFANALRMSAHTASGRLSAGISARLMVRQVMDVEAEVKSGRKGR